MATPLSSVSDVCVADCVMTTCHCIAKQLATLERILAMWFQRQHFVY